MGAPKMYDFSELGIEENNAPQEDISSPPDIVQSDKPSDSAFHSVGKKPNPVSLTENWTADDPSIQCRYHGHVRFAHPATCEWHRHTGDPECALRQCPRMRLGFNAGVLEGI